MSSSMYAWAASNAWQASNAWVDMETAQEAIADTRRWRTQLELGLGGPWQHEIAARELLHRVYVSYHLDDQHTRHLHISIDDADRHLLPEYVRCRTYVLDAMADEHGGAELVKVGWRIKVQQAVGRRNVYARYYLTMDGGVDEILHILNHMQGELNAAKISIPAVD